MADSELLEYLRVRIVSLMGAVENNTGKLFSDDHSELEDEFWAAVDSKDLKALKRLNLEFCELADASAMD